MLQLAVTAHAEVANEVVLAASRLHSVLASWIGGYRSRGCRSAGIAPMYHQLAAALCKRGPQRVIFDREAASSRSRHVRCALKSGSEIRVLASAMMSLCGLMASPDAGLKLPSRALESCAMNSPTRGELARV